MGSETASGKSRAKRVRATTQKSKSIAAKSNEKSTTTKGRAELKASLKVVKGGAEGEKKDIKTLLIESIERRKQLAEANIKPPPKRRGRKPKDVSEYNAAQDDDAFGTETEIENLQYDTGIQIKKETDEFGIALDRFEEYDEELNFDW